MFINSDNGKQTIDRNGYGEFKNSVYDCERFKFRIEYNEEWLTFDGIAMEEIFNASYTHKEIQDMYNADSMESIAFIGGAACPQAQLLCAAVMGETIPENQLNETSMNSTINYMKDGISKQGGVMGNVTCYSANANGSGNKMIVYGYDYTLGGEKISSFNCMTNSGNNVIFLVGVYETAEGLEMLTDLVNNKLYFYSDSAAV